MFIIILHCPRFCVYISILTPEIIYSKLKIYNVIDRPPLATESFNKLVGCTKFPNDLIDNNLLYAVYRNCVSYLITNDKKLRHTAKKNRHI